MVERIGVTAGASAPDVLVQNVIARLRELGGKIVTEHPGREENVVFEVPPNCGSCLTTMPTTSASCFLPFLIVQCF